MPNYSPKAIANAFIEMRGNSCLPSQMLIQKLTYIAHGWNLAINKEPLVSEAPEAWDNGPVFRSIWDHIRDYGYDKKNRLLIDPINEQAYSASFSQEEREVLDHVWRKYGARTANELSRMTHEPNTPWSKAYFERGRNASLPNQEIRQHYIDLAMAGRTKK